MLELNLFSEILMSRAKSLVYIHCGIIWPFNSLSGVISGEFTTLALAMHEALERSQAF